jgi:glycosyltransferase involved in cell wall biosynthesis/CDP-glycerol glycerophosphotransferase (TagB/SpsB family)
MGARTAPLFSVVVPCRRERAWLRPCLDSVLSQSFQDIEVIGVDDASTDGSGRILDEYAAADPRVRVIHRAEHGGPGPARNAGLDVCRGRYVVFLDADDTMTPGSLAAIARRIAETGEADIVMFDYQRVCWDGQVVRNLRHEAFARDGSGVFTAVERPVFLTFLEVVWNKAYRRDYLDRHGFRFREGCYQAVPWTYATMLAAERIATLDRVVVHFRRHRIRRIERSRSHFDIFEQYDAACELVPSESEWRRFIFDRALDHMLTVLARPDRLDPDDREEFFHAAADFARRRRPIGYTAERTRRGFRRWLLVRDDYPAYAALAMGAQAVADGGARVAAVRDLPGSIARFAAELPPVRDARSLRTVLRAVRSSIGTPSTPDPKRHLDPDLAVFASNGFRDYSCNPRAIYERATELLPNLRGVWIVQHDRVETIPPGVEYVVARTPGYYSVLSRATYLVNNVNFGDDVRKRDGQIHVHTHHGTPFEPAGVDTGKDLTDLMRRVDRWDYSVSANRFSTEIWERVYPATYETLEFGNPRNDRLLTATLDDVRKVRADLGYDDATPVVLSTLDTPLELGGNARVLGPGDHPDVLLAADVLVTDGSPLMVDYANLDRPIVVVGTAEASYLDVAATPPGVIVHSPAEVRTVLEDGSHATSEMADRRRVFRERFCEYDDGRAAERVVRKVFQGVDPDPVIPFADRRPAPSPYWLDVG